MIPMESTSKRNIKDSVFTHLFRDKKYIVELYETLFPQEEKITEDDIKILTLKNILVNSIYNDLGFMVKDKFIILVEAQSTWSMNILVRILMYLASTYKDYILEQEIDLYGSAKAVLPKPELFVVYTGDKVIEQTEISLAEEFFGGEKNLDLRVKVLTGGKKNDIVYQYVAFTKVLKEQIAKHGRTALAIRETIRICKDEDILKEYLARQETEVYDMVCTLFDYDTYMELHDKSLAKESLAKGRAEGRAEGKAEGRAELIEAMKRAGVDPEMVLKYTNA